MLALKGGGGEEVARCADSLIPVLNSPMLLVEESFDCGKLALNALDPQLLNFDPRVICKCVHED